MQRVLKLLWVGAATALLVGGSASAARAADDELITAHVPFAFVVGDERLPAGEYIINEMPDHPSVLSITSADGRQAALTLTISATSLDRRSQPELVFEKFGGQYFLARLRPESGDARDITLTPATVAHELAAVARKP